MTPPSAMTSTAPPNRDAMDSTSFMAIPSSAATTLVLSTGRPRARTISRQMRLSGTRMPTVRRLPIMNFGTSREASRMKV